MGFLIFFAATTLAQRADFLRAWDCCQKRGPKIYMMTIPARVSVITLALFALSCTALAADEDRGNLKINEFNLHPEVHH
jgi:hypothetical protein